MVTPYEHLKPFTWRLTDAYSDFLAQYPWQWFVTLTFTDHIHPEAAGKLQRLWLSKLNRYVHGRNWYKKHPYGVYWVSCTEYQQRGVLHYHLLINGVNDTRRLTFKDIWENLDHRSGYSRIEAVAKNQAVSRYLCKYVAKEALISFSENLPNLRYGFGALWHDSNS